MHFQYAEINKYAKNQQKLEQFVDKSIDPVVSIDKKKTK